MDNPILREIIEFFRIEGFINIVKSGNLRAFATKDGIQTFFAPLAPAIILFEILWLLASNNFNAKNFKIPFFIIVFNRFAKILIKFSMVFFCIELFQDYAILQTTNKWYWFIYAYFAYELGTFVYHYTAHKIRVLWCLHAIHHSPEHLNSSVTLNTIYVESLYTEFVRTTICVLLGVSPFLYFSVMILDSIWGAILHISEDSLKKARLGFLEKFILTPSHHRVHHAKHPLYMDTNFCGLINVWDRVFNTYQEEDDTVPLEYGITREMDATNFKEVVLGEFADLWHDVRNAPTLLIAIKYIFMPPGWSHLGNSHTSSSLKKQLHKH